MKDIKNSSSDRSAARSTSSSKLATASNDVVVGFDDDLLAIKEQLCGESSSLQVIPIVGMGGIGKTTLARNAYHDPLVREVFHIGGWVTVSQSYSVKEILSSLQKSLKLFDAKSLVESRENAEIMSESPEEVLIQTTADKVYKILKARKYVVVLDDIWSTKAWDDLKRLFPNDRNGSRIIMTTRLLDVATYTDGCSPREMRLMHEDQSWNLLRQKVFMDRVRYHELEDIGMVIARSCGGLPLAIVVIAGLLSTVNKTRASWEEMVEKVNSTVAAKDGQFEKILSLSYTDLPRHLRQCFVYMGGFPEDQEINAWELTKMWVAEGFVGARSASKSLEEEAEECLEDLVKRSLVLVTKRKSNNKIKRCSLHDLMRDLCRRKADEEKFPLFDMTPVDRFREASSKDVRYLRVVYWPPDASIRKHMSRLSNLNFLVLDDFVPATVSYLENLHTLIIQVTAGALVHLPPEIWTMKQLRHLISSFDRLPCPQGATSFPLENLQTISQVSNLECSYRFVKMIPNIKKLGLLYSASYEYEQAYHLHQLENLYDHVRDCNYRLENLKWLHRLENLKLHLYPGFQGELLNLVFPQSLKKLTLSGWRLPSWEDMTIVGSLPNLQVLKLRCSGGQGERWKTTEGEFAQLSFLLIEGSDLREWITEPEHFPRLKSLLLRYCWHLHEIPKDVGDIPTLELIEVKEGSASLFKSAKRIKEDQENNGNDNLQVRCLDYEKWVQFKN